MPTANTKEELGFYIFIETSLLFLLINWNPSLAIVYIAMVFISANIYANDKNVEYPLGRQSTSFVTACFQAAVAYFIFIYSAKIIFTQFALLTPGQTILDVYQATTPAFAGSFLLNAASLMFLIPIIESTYFFLRLFERIKEWSFHKFQNKTFAYITLILVISAIFAVFHSTAKGVTNTSALLLTSYFAICSMVLVLLYREGKQAVIFHVISNSIAVLKLNGYIQGLNV